MSVVPKSPTFMAFANDNPICDPYRQDKAGPKRNHYISLIRSTRETISVSFRLGKVFVTRGCQIDGSFVVVIPLLVDSHL
jgi:hypothetical protein